MNFPPIFFINKNKRVEPIQEPSQEYIYPKNNPKTETFIITKAAKGNIGMKASIIYDNSKSLEEEKEKLLKEKESLEASIARREKLLSNSNYVEKAPKAIVDKDREALLKEKEMLDIILNKING